MENDYKSPVWKVTYAHFCYKITLLTYFRASPHLYGAMIHHTPYFLRFTYVFPLAAIPIFGRLLKQRLTKLQEFSSNWFSWWALKVGAGVVFSTVKMRTQLTPRTILAQDFVTKTCTPLVETILGSFLVRRRASSFGLPLLERRICCTRGRICLCTG